LELSGGPLLAVTGLLFPAVSVKPLPPAAGVGGDSTWIIAKYDKNGKSERNETQRMDNPEKTGII
jgi:hypothetical protein